MDITSIAAEIAQDEEGVELPIFQKNGDPYTYGDDDEQCTITVVGPDSKRVRAAERANTRRTINRGRTKVSAEALHEARVYAAAAAVTDWKGWSNEGAPFEPSPANVRKLLMIAPHILRQVEEGVASHADFFERQSSD